MKAFELKFRIRAGAAGFTGKSHTMAFEAPTETYLLGSIDEQFEVLSCTEIPHPGEPEAPDFDITLNG